MERDLDKLIHWSCYLGRYYDHRKSGRLFFQFFLEARDHDIEYSRTKTRLDQRLLLEYTDLHILEQINFQNLVETTTEFN